MGTGTDEPGPTGLERVEGVPDIRPWREVGWIFRNGDALAIERSGERIRTRATRVTHLREEECPPQSDFGPVAPGAS